MARRGTVAKIELTQLEKLCALQCTDEEIASWFGVSTRTIERRRKERKFAAVMERGKAKGRISVRRMQMKLLEQGNATMAVWLGKQLLAQKDQVEKQHTGVSGGPPPGWLVGPDLNALSNSELEQMEALVEKISRKADGERPPQSLTPK
jgi:hypothetical protein